jgi:SSS family solute:Na+ symporter
LSTTGIIIDGLIILFYFVGIVAIGLYVGRRENSLHDFALGGRRVPWWAVMASIIAAETSAATFLGAPGEGYAKLSLSYVQLVFGLIIGRVLVGYVFLKPYYRYKVYTVYDYLAIRFGDKSKNYISLLFLIMRTLASGTRLFVPAIVVVLAWNIFIHGQENVQYSESAIQSVWPYFWAILALTLVTFIYTALGGIKAVIWTDVIQATLMFGSALVAVATLLYQIGGDSWNFMNGFRALGEAVPQMKTTEGYIRTGFEAEAVADWQLKQGISAMTAWEYVKLILFSDYTIFSALIGATVGNMAAFGTDQDMVQRLLTAETYQKSRRSLITAAFMDLPIAAVFTFIGILLYVYYQQDPTYRPEANADVFGSYILNVMPTGVRGLVLAGVFATTMGSLSAALNALATSATNDWFIPYAGKKQTEANHVLAARVFTGIFAVLMICIAVAFAYAKVKNPDVRILPVVLGIAGFILGPMLGVFLLGMLTKRRGSDTGNMIAITVGLIVTIFLGGLHVVALDLVAPTWSVTRALDAWQKEHVTISFTWFALVGALTVFLVGVLFRTPPEALQRAIRQGEMADEGQDSPVHLRK